MAKLCESCGKKNNYLINNPLELEDEKILCCKCAESVSSKLCLLEKAKSIDEATMHRNAALSIANQQFAPPVLKMVATQINKRFEQKVSRIHAKQQRICEEEKLSQLKQNHKLTTGYNFEGFSICEYLGVISGQIVLGTGFLSEWSASLADFFGAESDRFSDKLEEAKNAAITKLVDKSIAQGGNAIIGVDFDYIIFNNNVIGVVVNGTSVVIKRNTETDQCQ